MECRNRSSLHEVIAAIEKLVELGLVEDSGQRKRSPSGTLDVVWRLTALGHLVGDYQRCGLTFAYAVTEARAGVGRAH